MTDILLRGSMADHCDAGPVKGSAATVGDQSTSKGPSWWPNA